MWASHHSGCHEAPCCHQGRAGRALVQMVHLRHRWHASQAMAWRRSRAMLTPPRSCLVLRCHSWSQALAWEGQMEVEVAGEEQVVAAVQLRKHWRAGESELGGLGKAMSCQRPELCQPGATAQLMSGVDDTKTHKYNQQRVNYAAPARSLEAPSVVPRRRAWHQVQSTAPHPPSSGTCSR